MVIVIGQRKSNRIVLPHIPIFPLGMAYEIYSEQIELKMIQELLWVVCGCKTKGVTLGERLVSLGKASSC